MLVTIAMVVQSRFGVPSAEHIHVELYSTWEDILNLNVKNEVAVATLNNAYLWRNIKARQSWIHVQL